MDARAQAQRLYLHPLKPAIGITLGDPGGIGPEIIEKTLRSLKKNLSFQPVLFGVPQAFDAAFLRSSFLRFADVSEKIGRKETIGLGKVALSNARIAYAAIRTAAEQAGEGKLQAIVTAPVNKTAMRLMDPRFHGHTELLAETAGAKKFAMMFVSPRLKVTLTTIHVALHQVNQLIQKNVVFDKIKLTHDFLKRYFRISKPHLAVCALNPHGKETGTEDEAEIRPAVQKARRGGINAEGPLPGDQVFYDAYHGRFDAVISMYHDQGLAPFKMIAFRDGVNVTLGLPYIRTSPDHGTAFDIAGKGKADPASFQSALELAIRLCRPKSNS